MSVPSLNASGELGPTRDLLLPLASPSLRTIMTFCLGGWPAATNAAFAATRSFCACNMASAMDVPMPIAALFKPLQVVASLFGAVVAFLPSAFTRALVMSRPPGGVPESV